ncbi:MAG: GIY-YIG nuclease family protein [Patescibacteria group bacterium]|nr:GIY-YIG nuclease family protein [Patescibacteria group bacterium]
MTLEEFKKKAKKMPDVPGVYFFLDKHKKILYIGKATSLRDRVRSYFAPDLAESRGPWIVAMIEKATSIDWRQTDSVLEALILEANLIKNYKPKHNTDLKDDKSWNYVVITKEDFPRVLLVRGKELAQQQSASVPLGSSQRSLQQIVAEPAKTFGPFPHGLQLKEAMRIIRKIFPYRDTCVPAPEMIAAGKKPKACFNRHIGLCPGVCTGEISKTEYRKIIRRITLLFEGKKQTLLKSLERDMHFAARKEIFEEAASLRKQIFALQHIQDVSLIKDEYRYYGFTKSVSSGRIEAYDIAHLAGSANVGVMTVVEDGMAQKSEYRKFRIRSAKAGDDAGALREILSRRLGHEWPLPRLIAVDGAAAQINAAQRVLKEYGVGIPVVGVVKDEKHRPREIRGLPARAGDRTQLERDILLANAEAHRFAITYHRKRSRRDLTIK